MLWYDSSYLTNARDIQSANNPQTLVIIAALVFAAVGCLATASRMAWAFARERGLPASSILAKVRGSTDHTETR